MLKIGLNRGRFWKKHRHFGVIPCVLFLSAIAVSTLQADSFSFTGTFSTDDQVQLFDFTLTSDATVTFQTYGYGGGTNAANAVIPAGGFQSELTWFTADGALQSVAGDGCGAAGVGNSTFCLDTFTQPFLSAGTYILALTQTGNDPVGNLSDGFSSQDTGDFTASGTCTAFCNAIYSDQDNGNWAVDISGVTSASAVGAAPEPGTIFLLACGLSLIGLANSHHFNLRSKSSENTREN